jgi:hypothetical protein
MICALVPFTTRTNKPFKSRHCCVYVIVLFLMKVAVVGAGPVGALAALYAAHRGHEVVVYELRSGKHLPSFHSFLNHI